MQIRLQNGKWDGIWDKPKYQEMRNLIKESFKDLIFIEEGHKYFLDGKQMTCVSDVTHLFKPHFDSETKAQETFERNFDNPDSKYYRMTAEEILKQWKETSENACKTGSERHAFGESCFWFMTKQNDGILPEFRDRLEADGCFVTKYPKEEAIAKFWQDLPVSFVPIAVENLTFRRDLNYSGTFDALFYYDAELNGGKPEDSGAVIFDYKTNVDLYKNFKEQRLLPPFEGLLDCSLNIYKLQLSLYQLALEKIGFNVIGRRLIWLKPTGEYEKIPLESYANKLENYLINNPII